MVAMVSPVPVTLDHPMSLTSVSSDIGVSRCLSDIGGGAPVSPTGREERVLPSTAGVHPWKAGIHDSYSQGESIVVYPRVGFQAWPGGIGLARTPPALCRPTLTGPCLTL